MVNPSTTLRTNGESFGMLRTNGESFGMLGTNGESFGMLRTNGESFDYAQDEWWVKWVKEVNGVKGSIDIGWAAEAVFLASSSAAFFTT
jgi:hypothetical protein